MTLRVLSFGCDHFDYTPYTSIFFSGICIIYLQGLGQKILPGNYVVKKHPKTGVHKKIFLEHALGYFWAFKVGMCLLLIFILFIFIFVHIEHASHLLLLIIIIVGAITY